MSTGLTVPSDAQVPAFLQEGVSETALTLLSQYAAPPRMKIRQPTARSPLSEMAPEGSVVLMPSMQILASLEEEFYVTPVFFYPEWCVFNPLNMQDLPTIRERSLDPMSDLAKRSRNAETRKAPMPGFESDFNNPDPKKRKSIEYREHLNFIFAVQGGDLDGVQFVATFAKGEHKTGRTLSSNIQMRTKSQRINPWGQVFATRSVKRENNDGKWYGLNFYLPTSGVSPYVTSKEQYDRLQADHNELFKAWESKQIGDFIKPEDDVDTAPSAESSDF